MAPITLQFPIILGAAAAAAAADGEEPSETAAELKDDILEEILSWVPAKSVLRWKSVCKPWHRMVDKPIFARIHFSRASVSPLLVSGGKSVCRSCRIMHLVEGRSVSDLDSGTPNSKLISRFDIRTRAAAEPAKVKDVFLGLNTNATSCEGLLCWTAYDQNRGDLIIISNPITAEYVSLSSSPMDEDEIYAFVGMGYSRATKKFELLRMAARADDDEEDPLWWPEIRAVGGGGGDGCWRRAGGGTSQLVLCRTISQVVYVGGGVYWSYDGDSVICCFDFDRALFQVMALPKMSLSMLEYNSISSKCMSLGVLDGALCASLVCPGDGHVELFVLLNGGGNGLQWKKLYDVETKTTYLEHIGVLWPRGQYKAIKYLSDGEILMHDWRGKFVIYDPIIKEEKHVCVLEDSRLEEDLRNDGVDDLQVVSHIPRLVRLKEALNVGDEEMQVMKALNLYDEEEGQVMEERSPQAEED